MGMYNENRPKFVSIVEGLFVSGKDAERVEANRISGSVVGLKLLDDEYAGKKYKKIQIELVDFNSEGISQMYWLQFPLTSGYGISFCMMLPLLKFSVPVIFSAKSEQKENGKYKTTLFCSQGGNSVKWYYTKDNPRDLPPLVQDERGWDSTAQQKFLIADIERVGENLRKSYTGVGAGTVLGKIANKAEIIEPVDPPELFAPIDDLPF